MQEKRKKISGSRMWWNGLEKSKKDPGVEGNRGKSTTTRGRKRSACLGSGRNGFIDKGGKGRKEGEG